MTDLVEFLRAKLSSDPAALAVALLLAFGVVVVAVIGS